MLEAPAEPDAATEASTEVRSVEGSKNIETEFIYIYLCISILNYGIKSIAVL